MSPTISCNSLAGITTPRTLKIEGHIKKKKLIVLIYSGSTHNFIHCKVAKELNCFLYPAPECQVMVSNGGTINFSRKCHNIKLTMGEYVLNSPILSNALHDMVGLISSSSRGWFLVYILFLFIFFFLFTIYVK